METIDYHGWPNSVRLANDAIELVALTDVGPRIMRLAFHGGENLLWEDPDLLGKTGPADTWVNYGGHRLWHAPEVHPRTYAPDNGPVEVAHDAEAKTLVLVQPIEQTTGIRKAMVITVAEGDLAAVRVEHRLTNANPWEVELAPWALTVVASGGRVILPQEPYRGHGEDNDYLPARPLVLWPFTNMEDPRWTWGKTHLQLRSDASNDEPQKIGIYNEQGWGAYARPNGDVLTIMIDPDPFGPSAYPDFGSNFETFTKGAFQELETLGPLSRLEPGQTVIHTEIWSLTRGSALPDDDAGLAAMTPDLADQAHEAAAYFDMTE